jgi:hypothetical protein
MTLVVVLIIEVAEPVKDAPKDTPKTSGKYVPPAMRKAQSETPAGTVSGGTSRLGARGKKSAPDVNSQDDFPTLGSIAEPKYDIPYVFASESASM